METELGVEYTMLLETMVIKDMWERGYNPCFQADIEAYWKELLG